MVVVVEVVVVVVAVVAVVVVLVVVVVVAPEPGGHNGITMHVGLQLQQLRARSLSS